MLLPFYLECTAIYIHNRWISLKSRRHRRPHIFFVSSPVMSHCLRDVGTSVNNSWHMTCISWKSGTQAGPRGVNKQQGEISFTCITFLRREGYCRYRLQTFFRLICISCILNQNLLLSSISQVARVPSLTIGNSGTVLSAYWIETKAGGRMGRQMLLCLPRRRKADGGRPRLDA